MVQLVWVRLISLVLDSIEKKMVGLLTLVVRPLSAAFGVRWVLRRLVEVAKDPYDLLLVLN